MAERKKRAPAHYQLLWALMADDGLSAAAKCVATILLLQFRNHQTAQCNPSFATIAERVGRKRRAVIDAINELKGRGWLKWEGTAGGSSANTNNFQFLFRTTSAADCTPTGASDDTGAVEHTTGAAERTRPVQYTAHEPSIEPSNNQSSAVRCLIDDEKRQRGVNVRCESPSGYRWQRYWRENRIPEPIRSTRTDCYLGLPSQDPPGYLVESAA
jgi:hypothetical protein